MLIRTLFVVLVLLVSAQAEAARWSCSAFCGGRSLGGNSYMIEALPVTIGGGSTSEAAYKDTLKVCKIALREKGHTPARTILFSSRVNPAPHNHSRTRYIEALIADICVKNYHSGGIEIQVSE